LMPIHNSILFPMIVPRGKNLVHLWIGAVSALAVDAQNAHNGKICQGKFSSAFH